LFRLILQEHLKNCLVRTLERVTWLLDLERDPFTLNSHYLSDYKDKFLSEYRLKRQQDIHGDVLNTLKDDLDWVSHGQVINDIVSKLATLGIREVNSTDLAKLLKSDAMDPALEIMAEVRAYFQGEILSAKKSIIVMCIHDFCLSRL
jgi:hypothetical protein